MAIRSLQKVRRPPTMRLIRDSSGVIGTGELDRLAALAERTARFLVGGLSFGTGEPSSVAGAFKGQFIRHIFSATPDTLETIPHGLGVVPLIVLPVCKDRACDIYDSTFKKGWGTTQIQLYCSVASAKVDLLVLA